MRIVVPDDYPPALSGSRAESLLRALGETTIFAERGADDEATLIRRIANADAVLNIRAHAHYTARVLDANPALRIISVWGTGVDHIDLDACRARDVTVCNTPGVNAHAVAEHSIALILAAARQIRAMDRGTRAGQWPRAVLVQLEGKTLGVIGLGAIGRRVASLARAFGMHVLAWTPSGDANRGTSLVSLDDLLRESDFVSLHVKLTAETRGILSRDRLAMMKPTAILVNTARGALVDRDALIDALRSGRIAAAALDVFHEEPLPAGDPLTELPNVVLTPHNAGTTREVIDTGLTRAVENIERYFRGEPRDTVMSPQR
jgi:phosphoglycerate dehydrogenase-like enzyme